MTALADVLALQAAAEAIKHQEEKRKIAQFCRLNATTQRNLPHIPDDQNPLSVAIGLVNAIQTQQGGEGDSSGQTGRQPDAPASTGGAVSRPPEAVAPASPSPRPEAPSQGTVGEGSAIRSNPGTDAGATNVAAPAARPSDVKSAWLKYIPWVIAAGSGLAGAGGLGFALNAGKPADSVTIQETAPTDYEYPLLDYIEEQGWHRK